MKYRNLKELNLKPGDVIVAKENINYKDLNFPKCAKTWLGRLSKHTNMYNMSPTSRKYYTSAPYDARKGQIIGMVVGDKFLNMTKEEKERYDINNLYLEDNWSCGTDHDTLMLRQIHLCYDENLIDIIEFNELDPEMRKFLRNKRICAASSFKIPAKDIEVMDFNYDKHTDTLYIKEAYDSNDIMVNKMRIKNLDHYSIIMSYNGQDLYDIS